MPQQGTSFNYDPTLATSRDKVRFFLSDTSPASYRLTNEEIDGVLAIWSDPLEAAAVCADQLSARYASATTVRIGNFSRSGGEASTYYGDLAAKLRASRVNRPGGLGTPFVGGVSQAAMATVESNTDRTPSKFKIGQHDNPAAVPDPSSPAVEP